MKKSENPAVLCGVLFVISAAVALLLAITNSITADKILQNAVAASDCAKQEVLEQAATFEEISFSDTSGIVKAVYAGKAENGDTVGWCVNVIPVGYGGEIDMMVGIAADKTVSGVSVVSMSETAGLGAKAKDEEFRNEFVGKSAEKPLRVIKNGTPAEDEISAISGATITSNAVKDGVCAAMEVCKQ